MIEIRNLSGKNSFTWYEALRPLAAFATNCYQGDSKAWLDTMGQISPRLDWFLLIFEPDCSTPMPRDDQLNETRVLKAGKTI